ncbi:hypothetical protein P7K49_001028 [Saguinus oedipus]|uniref:60S ribosomal protein L27 n=1 Tax=Saguinus oedipus TaxID=9490 RepID=A0ABQ9WDB3_SAGOE|nr:hypothetical protein P7K49_001028 [Saguinus oedipus]
MQLPCPLRWYPEICIFTKNRRESFCKVTQETLVRYSGYRVVPSDHLQLYISQCIPKNVFENVNTQQTANPKDASPFDTAGILTEGNAPVVAAEIGKLMKPRKVVLVLAGCYCGRKAVIMKNTHDGTSDRSYSHALVAGIDHCPHKVTAAMGKKKIAKRSNIQSFVKVYNYSHLMPTRYSVESP